MITCINKSELKIVHNNKVSIQNNLYASEFKIVCKNSAFKMANNK